MIDTLKAGIDVVGYPKSGEINLPSIYRGFRLVQKDDETTQRICTLLDRLDEKKQEAKRIKSENLSGIVLVQIGNFYFEIIPNGNKQHAYILHNDLFQIAFSQYRAKTEGFFPISVIIKSEALWTYSPQNCWQMVLDFIRNHVGEIKTNKVSRVDLCCHTDKISIGSDEEIKEYQGKFHKDNIIRNNRSFETVSFGARGRKVFARIYNKTAEIMKSNKLWFIDIWNQFNLNPSRVWNIEFEVKRDFFKDHEIETVEQAFECLGTIWRYCTEEWLVKKDLIYSEISRCPINNDWIELQNSFNEYGDKQYITRYKQLTTSAEKQLPPLLGYLTTYGALIGKDNIQDVFTEAEKKSFRYYANKGTSFSKEVQKKMKLQYGKEVS